MIETIVGSPSFSFCCVSPIEKWRYISVMSKIKNEDKKKTCWYVNHAGLVLFYNDLSGLPRRQWESKKNKLHTCPTCFLVTTRVYVCVKIIRAYYDTFRFSYIFFIREIKNECSKKLFSIVVYRNNSIIMVREKINVFYIELIRNGIYH